MVKHSIESYGLDFEYAVTRDARFYYVIDSRGKSVFFAPLFMRVWRAYDLAHKFCQKLNKGEEIPLKDIDLTA